MSAIPKISLSVCLIFLAAARAAAGDKADAALQAVQAAAVGDAALQNSGNSEKSMSLSRSWTTGEKPGRPGLAVLTDRNSSASLKSTRSGKPDDLSRDPSLSPAVSAEIIPMPALSDPKADLIFRMIESDHALSDRERFVLLETLGEYKLEALQGLYDSGFRVMVTENYKNFPSSRYGPGSAYYQSGKNPKVVMRKDYLDGHLWTRIRTAVKNAASWLTGEEPWGGSRETFMHEMGHAWDAYVTQGYAWDAYRIKGGEEIAPKVQELFTDYQNAVKKGSGSRWSYYAANAVADDPVEYLAEGYRMFGQSDKTRKNFAEKDPEFYKLIKSRAAVLYEAEIP